MEDYEYKTKILDNLIVQYTARNNIVVEHEKDVTVEGRTMKSTVITGRFTSGFIVTTATIGAWIEQNPNDREQCEYRRKFVYFLLLRHFAGDWGIQCLEDFLMNEESLRDGERILSVYKYPLETELSNAQKFWIITEWDRSVTTVLDPMDY